MTFRIWLSALALGLASASHSPARAAPIRLLNVSYDPTRELYQDINAAFAPRWQAPAKQQIAIRQSHGGSGKQARAVIDGLPADVVTLALAYDIDEIAKPTRLIAPNWQKRLPNNSDALLFDDRLPGPQGQPEGDQGLGRPDQAGRQGHHPQPQDQRRRALELSRGLGLCAASNTASPAKAREFMTRLFRNVPVLDSGARGSTTTFVQRGQGDVLLAWENEAFLAVNKLGKGKFDIVVPSVSILAEPPVAVVDKVVDKQGHAQGGRSLSQVPLHAGSAGDHRQELLSPAQRRRSRPSTRAASPTCSCSPSTAISAAGGRPRRPHFNDGGLFDQIFEAAKR